MMLPVVHAEDCARRAIARGLRVREPMGLAAWSDRYRMLSQKEASEYGKFDVDRIPFIRGIMDALEERHPANEVIYAKCVQTAGTTIGQNWIGWTMHQSPATMMILVPTEAMGLRWVRSKLHPMIASTPVLAKIMPPGRRAEDVTMTEKHFNGGVLYFASANKKNDMTMVACRRLLLDEVDRFPRDLEGEGDPVELVKNRTSTYVGRWKVFEVSTPTDQGSRIDADYKRSSRGRYLVPCPHCGHEQRLRWGNLSWSEGSPERAAYRCESEPCGALIEEHHKTEMLRRGQWQHERPELCSTIIGFHVNALYVPTGLGPSWAELAREYDRVKRDPSKLRVFENTKLAEIHIGENVVLDSDEVGSRVEDYQVRTIPPGVLLLTAGADVQHDRVEVQIVGWGRDEIMTVVDYAVFYGAPDGTEVWARLDEYLATPIRNAHGVDMRIACALVDAGNWQHEVTNFTRGLRARNVFACKGATSRLRPPIGKPTLVDVTYRGKSYKRGAELFMLGVHIIKNTLFARLKADATQPEAPVAVANRRIHFPASGLPKAYFEQLTAEVYNATSGRWETVRERNEALDTLVYATAAALHHSVAVHRMRESDWQRLAQLYAPTAAEPKADAPALGKVPVETSGGGFLPTSARVTRSN